jgi:hypothetical protein
LQVTSHGDVVVDYNGRSANYLDTLGGRNYGHVTRTTIESGGIYLGKFAFTQQDHEVWIMMDRCGSDCWATKYAYPSGGAMTTAGRFEHTPVGGVAAVD